MTTERDDSTTEQAVARVNAETMVLFDRHDDAQIVARIQGRAIKECVYGFRQGGTMIYGLSADGAEECKREMARLGEVIREDDIQLVREDTDYAYFKAFASRWAITLGKDTRLDTAVELKRQPKFITLRDGTTMPDEFWFEKGGSKAMRNAVLNLTPETVKQLLIERYKSLARIVEHTPENADARTHEIHGQMVEKDKRDELIREIKDRWRAYGWTVAKVKTFLVERGLSETLASERADWSSLPLDIIEDLRVATERAGA